MQNLKQLTARSSFIAVLLGCFLACSADDLDALDDRVVAEDRVAVDDRAAVDDLDAVDHPGTQSLKVGDMLIQSGAYRKTTTFATVNFPQHFGGTPTVVVSPWWQFQHSGVGHAETIEEITKTNFKLASANKANNYFVTWIAIGPS